MRPSVANFVQRYYQNFIAMQNAVHEHIRYLYRRSADYTKILYRNSCVAVPLPPVTLSLTLRCSKWQTDRQALCDMFTVYDNFAKMEVSFVKSYGDSVLLRTITSPQLHCFTKWRSILYYHSISCAMLSLWPLLAK